jgi:hypothetical protein
VFEGQVLPAGPPAGVTTDSLEESSARGVRRAARTTRLMSIEDAADA